MLRTAILILLLATGKLYAQNYTRDAGARVGDGFSVTYRQYQEHDQALEGMLFLGRNGMTVTILKEYFRPLTKNISDYLFFEYGFGAHAGFRNVFKYRVLNRTYVFEEGKFTPLLGINGLAGLEYRFPEFPFVVSVDVKPYFEYSVIQIFSIYLHSIGISLKYKF
ncbi:MAG: hypothetical protein JXA61_05075 [Bacteroidales bacterium]|nr:hypothetical protein [Bacteroidales bacterium]